MAEQARNEKDAAVIELTEAIQVERYVGSHNPSTRILKQKLTKVDDKLENAKQSHYAYCRKAKIDLASKEVTSFVNQISDEAVDCTDKGLLFIEEREVEEASREKNVKDEAREAERKAKLSAKTVQLMSN